MKTSTLSHCVVSTAVMLAIWAGPGGLGFNAVQADDGHWRLEQITPLEPEEKEGQPAGILLPWRTSSSRTTNGVTTKTDYFAKDSRNVVDTFSINWSWSPIPVILVPGEKLSLTLRGTVAAYPTWENGFVGLSYPYLKGQFRWPTDEGAWGRGAVFADAKNVAIIQFTTGGEIKDKPKSITLQTSTEVPDGREGRDLAIVMEIDHPKWWDWQYIYVWDAGPAPATRPEPIPAGQTLDGPDNVARVIDPATRKPDDPSSRKPEDPSSISNVQDPTRVSISDQQAREDDQDRIRRLAGDRRLLMAAKRTAEPNQIVMVPFYLIRPEGVAQHELQCRVRSVGGRPG